MVEAPGLSASPLALAAFASSTCLLPGPWHFSQAMPNSPLPVAFQMPDRLARYVRASRWNIIATGRNLAVWTKYKGVDPEATAGNSDARGFEEFFSTPPLRTVTFRMNFTF